MTEAEHERRRRFEGFFQQHLAEIAAYCQWRAPSDKDAEDAVSEVFLLLWRRLNEVPAEATRAWLYAAARKVMANQLRARRRRLLLQVRLSLTAPRLEGSGREPRVREEPARDAENVRQALARLKPVDQEVLLLAEWQGLTPAEIAGVMHCPAVTVRGRLHRARRRFRTAFEELSDEQAPESTLAIVSHHTQGA